MLNLIDSVGALRAFRQAAECDPDGFWMWIEIGRLEQTTGTLSGAAEAIDAALRAAVGDERSRSVALIDPA
jgi:predicted TPR repeat methyltransferase